MPKIVTVDVLGPVGSFTRNFWEASHCNECPNQKNCEVSKCEKCKDRYNCPRKSNMIHACDVCKHYCSEILIAHVKEKLKLDQITDRLVCFLPPDYPLPLFFRTVWKENFDDTKDNVFVYDTLPYEMHSVPSLFPPVRPISVHARKCEFIKPPPEVELRHLKDRELKEVYSLLLIKFFRGATKITLHPLGKTTSEVGIVQVFRGESESLLYFAKFGPPEELERECQNCNEISIHRTDGQKLLTACVLSDCRRLIAESAADFTGLLVTKKVSGRFTVDQPPRLCDTRIEEHNLKHVGALFKDIVSQLSSLHGNLRWGPGSYEKWYGWAFPPTETLRCEIPTAYIRSDSQPRHEEFRIKTARLIESPDLGSSELILDDVCDGGSSKRVRLSASNQADPIGALIKFAYENRIIPGRTLYIDGKLFGNDLRSELKQKLIESRIDEESCGILLKLIEECGKRLKKRQRKALLGERIHGDLHSKNIICSDIGTCDFNIIDFASLQKDAPISWDYAKLELSLRLDWFIPPRIVELAKVYEARNKDIEKPKKAEFVAFLKSIEVQIRESWKRMQEIKVECPAMLSKFESVINLLMKRIQQLRKSWRTRVPAWVKRKTTDDELKKDYYGSLFFAAIADFAVLTPYPTEDEGGWIRAIWSLVVASEALEVLDSK